MKFADFEIFYFVVDFSLCIVICSTVPTVLLVWNLLNLARDVTFSSYSSDCFVKTWKLFLTVLS